MLHRQPSSKDRARKSWEAILGLRYCTSHEKAAHGHVVYVVQEVPFLGYPLTPFLIPLVQEMSVVL